MQALACAKRSEQSLPVAIASSLRRERALGHGAEPGVSLTDVVLRLGYSELSAFSRAFRAWTGSSLRAYRRRASLAAAPRIR